MQMSFKYKLFSVFDSCDVFDEKGSIIYRVTGRYGFGRRFAERLIIKSSEGVCECEIIRKPFKVMSEFHIYKEGKFSGRIKKRFKPFVSEFYIDYKNWTAEGDMLKLDYKIEDREGGSIGKVYQIFYEMTNTYAIEAVKDEDALDVLVFALAMDSEKPHMRI